MQTLRCVLVLALLTAAPGCNKGAKSSDPGATSASEATPAPAATVAASCPDATAVRRVFWESEAVEEAEPKRTLPAGWRLPLRAPADEAPAKLPAEAPEVLWIHVDGAWCRTTPGPRFRITAPNDHYAASGEEPLRGVTLRGCAPAERRQQTSFALAVADEPTGCTLLETVDVVHDGSYDDDNNFRLPAEDVALPPAIAGVVPERACAAPACGRLFRVRHTQNAGTPAFFDVSVAWLQTADADACEWDGDYFAGLFVASPDGTPRPVALADNPIDASRLEIVATLASAGAPRVLLARDIDRYAAFDVAADGSIAGPGIIRWAEAHDELAADDETSLGPSCGP